jgi:hypothetical protein
VAGLRDDDEPTVDVLADQGLDDELSEFFAADDDAVSAARNRWRDRLADYVDRQGPLDALRLRPVSEPPWPGDDNPMYAYLLERSSEIAAESDLETALQWLGLNAWFEGCIAERSRVSRLLEDD